MDVNMTVSDALCALDKLECWRQPANEEQYSEDHPAEIEFELNSVQLSNVQLSMIQSTIRQEKGKSN